MLDCWIVITTDNWILCESVKLVLRSGSQNTMWFVSKFTCWRISTNVKLFPRPNLRIKSTFPFSVRLQICHKNLQVCRLYLVTTTEPLVSGQVWDTRHRLLTISYNYLLSHNYCLDYEICFQLTQRQLLGLNWSSTDRLFYHWTRVWPVVASSDLSNQRPNPAAI